MHKSLAPRTFAALLFCGCLAAATGSARAQLPNYGIGNIGTFAGDGVKGYNGNGSELNNPSGVATDSNGNIYIADLNNNRIRKLMASTDEISTVAGNGTQGYSGDGGMATEAELYGPHSVAVDFDGNIYIADTGNERIRVVNTQTVAITVAKVVIQPGHIATVAGTGISGYSGDNGPAIDAELFGALGIALDADNNLYIADSDNDRIRVVNTQTVATTVATVVIQPGDIATVAGNGEGGYSGDGGPATSAKLSLPWGVNATAGNLIYIADTGNNRIREINGSTGVISTVAGNGTAGYNGDGIAATSAELYSPTSVGVEGTIDGNNIWITDSNNNRIRVFGGAGEISTAIGDGTAGYSGDGGPAGSAEIYSPLGISVTGGFVYFADQINQRVRGVVFEVPR